MAMKYSTKRNISLLLALAFLAAALIVFFGLDWPALSKAKELNSKIKQEQTQYNTQLEAVQTAKSIIEQYKSLANVSQTISLSVPRGPEIQNILAQLDNLAIQSNLQVQSINFETPSISGPKKEKILVEENKILRISVSLIGDYESFKTWMMAVESNIRLMDVLKISFSSLGGEANLSRFNFKIILDTYYQ